MADESALTSLSIPAPSGTPISGALNSLEEFSRNIKLKVTANALDESGRAGEIAAAASPDQLIQADEIRALGFNNKFAAAFNQRARTSYKNGLVATVKARALELVNDPEIRYDPAAFRDRFNALSAETVAQMMQADPSGKLAEAAIPDISAYGNTLYVLKVQQSIDRSNDQLHADAVKSLDDFQTAAFEIVRASNDRDVLNLQKDLFKMIVQEHVDNGDFTPDEAAKMEASFAGDADEEHTRASWERIRPTADINSQVFKAQLANALSFIDQVRKQRDYITDPARGKRLADEFEAELASIKKDRNSTIGSVMSAINDIEGAYKRTGQSDRPMGQVEQLFNLAADMQSDDPVALDNLRRRRAGLDVLASTHAVLREPSTDIEKSKELLLAMKNNPQDKRWAAMTDEQRGSMIEQTERNVDRMERAKAGENPMGLAYEFNPGNLRPHEMSTVATRAVQAKGIAVGDPSYQAAVALEWGRLAGEQRKLARDYAAQKLDINPESVPHDKVELDGWAAMFDNERNVDNKLLLAQAFQTATEADSPAELFSIYDAMPPAAQRMKFATMLAQQPGGGDVARKLLGFWEAARTAPSAKELNSALGSTIRAEEVLPPDVLEKMEAMSSSLGARVEAYPLMIDAVRGSVQMQGGLDGNVQSKVTQATRDIAKAFEGVPPPVDWGNGQKSMLPPVLTDNAGVTDELTRIMSEDFIAKTYSRDWLKQNDRIGLPSTFRKKLRPVFLKDRARIEVIGTGLPLTLPSGEIIEVLY